MDDLFMLDLVDEDLMDLVDDVGFLFERQLNSFMIVRIMLGWMVDVQVNDVGNDWL